MSFVVARQGGNLGGMTPHRSRQVHMNTPSYVTTRMTSLLPPFIPFSLVFPATDSFLCTGLDRQICLIFPALSISILIYSRVQCSLEGCTGIDNLGLIHWFNRKREINPEDHRCSCLVDPFPLKRGTTGVVGVSLRSGNERKGVKSPPLILVIPIFLLPHSNTL